MWFNAGEVARQAVFHLHVHGALGAAMLGRGLLVRRRRHVIPDKGNGLRLTEYWPQLSEIQ
jgi:hypothetical protein